LLELEVLGIPALELELGIAGEVLAGARGPCVLPHGRAKVPELSQEDKGVYTTE
jgi:hypothetical protein